MSEPGDGSDDATAAMAAALVMRATADALNKAIEDAAKLGLKVQVEVERVSDGVGRLPQIRIEAERGAAEE